MKTRNTVCWRLNFNLNVEVRGGKRRYHLDPYRPIQGCYPRIRYMVNPALFGC